MASFYRLSAYIVPYRQEVLSIPPGEASLESCSISGKGAGLGLSSDSTALLSA